MSIMMRSAHWKSLLIAAALVLAVGIGFYALQPRDGSPSDQDTLPGQTTLVGETVCLPHRDTDGPQTMECAFGLRTDTGEHYALQLNLEQEGTIETGLRVSAEGLVIPIEAISTDMWARYDIVGVMQVLDITEVD